MKFRHQTKIQELFLRLQIFLFVSYIFNQQKSIISFFFDESKIKMSDSCLFMNHIFRLITIMSQSYFTSWFWSYNWVNYLLDHRRCLFKKFFHSLYFSTIVNRTIFFFHNKSIIFRSFICRNSRFSKAILMSYFRFASIHSTLHSIF